MGGQSNFKVSMCYARPEKVEDLSIAVESVFTQNGLYSETGMEARLRGRHGGGHVLNHLKFVDANKDVRNVGNFYVNSVTKNR